jgi:hypothetical protein
MEHCVRSRLAKAVLGVAYSLTLIGGFISDAISFGGGWLGGWLELAVHLVLFGSVWLGWALKRWKWALCGAGGAAAIMLLVYVWRNVVHPGQVMVDHRGPYLLGLTVLPFIAGLFYPGKWYVKLGFTVLGIMGECMALLLIGCAALIILGPVQD